MLTYTSSLTAVRRRLWPAALLAVLLLPDGGKAASFSDGDLIVGGRPGYSIEGGDAYVDRYSSKGVFVEHLAVLRGGDPVDVVSIGNDLIVANGTQLIRISSNGSVSLAVPWYFEFMLSLAVDAMNNIYAGEDAGRSITKVPSSGSQPTAYPVPVAQPEILAMDLQADQCTMFYASGSANVQRYDLCADKPLTDFGAVPPGFVLSIRILTNGDVLAGSSSGMYRFDGGGHIIRTYSVAAGLQVRRISVVPGEAAAWIGGARQLAPAAVVEKIDLDSGNVLTGPTPVLVPELQQQFPGFGFVPEVLLVVGDRRVAQAAGGADIPVFTPTVTILVLAALAIIGFFALRSA